MGFLEFLKPKPKDSKKSASTGTDRNSRSAKIYKQPKRKNLNNQYKVFKPNKDLSAPAKDIPEEEIKTKTKIPKIDIEVHSWLDFTAWRKRFRYLLLQLNILNKLNLVVLWGLVFSFVLSLFYLAIFDTYFLIKNYEIEFASNSYLSTKEVRAVTKQISDDYFLGLIPANQYWFLNEYSLTKAAQKAVPEISLVEVTGRSWPNKITLKIYTEPILLTLAVKEKGVTNYWRISQNGSVFTRDEANLRNKVVTVDRGINVLSGDTTRNRNLTFQDFELEREDAQFNRMWFIAWLWEQFKILEDDQGIDFEIVATRIPSLTDTDVILQTSEGTLLYFDSNITNLPKEIQEDRIRAIFSSSIVDNLKAGQIAYMDLRINNSRVFVCYKRQTCSGNSLT